MAGGHEIMSAPSFIVSKSSLHFRVPRIINGSKVDSKTLFFRLGWRHNWPVMLNN